MKIKLGQSIQEHSLAKTTITTEIVRKTPKAILVNQKVKHEAKGAHGAQWIERNLTGPPEVEEWLPKSQIQVDEDGIRIPGWLANKSRFVFENG